MKIVVFDFCETLVDFQTADEFVCYVIECKCQQEANRILNALKIKTTLIKAMHRLGLAKKYSTKEMYLEAINGIGQEDISEIAQKYYIERVKPHIIGAVIDELIKYKQQGYHSVILSGGYKSYIDFFAEDYGVDTVIANEIKFEDGISTGKLEEPDCLGYVKVDRFGKFVCGIDEKIDEVVFFTDSRLDEPFFERTDRTVIVSRQKHQKWVDVNKFEEIIW